MLKGVVLFSLNANHLPLCLKVIGANEHESHYLLDIVESNTSDIEIKAVSGDMHSINRCLLYTSPSPRDSLRSRMPSSA